MGTWAANELQLFELITRILRDPLPPYATNAVCIFGETIENEASMLEAAADIWRIGIAEDVAVTGYEGLEQGALRVSGSDILTEKLISMGINGGNITSFPLSKKLPPCTDAEAIGLVEFATQRGWKSLVVTVPPLHAVRAYISVVSAVLKAESTIKVWSCPGYELPWAEDVLHSQSAPRAKRREQFGGELSKLTRYMEKGDHVPPARIIEYMNWRDDT